MKQPTGQKLKADLSKGCTLGYGFESEGISVPQPRWIMT